MRHAYCVLPFYFLLFTACSKPDVPIKQPNENVRSLAGFVSNNYDFTLLKTALEYTGLMDTLNTAGTYTLLAPDNTAWNELGVYSNAQILAMDRDSLRTALAYHILPITLREGDIPLGMPDERYRTLSEDSLYASRIMNVNYSTTANGYNTILRGGLTDYRSSSAVIFSGVDATVLNLEFSNGVLHRMAGLLKRFPGVSVQTWLDARPQYSVFVAGLKKFGLWDELATEGPFTVFAPQNAALEEQGITSEFVQNLDIAEYIGPKLFGAYIMYDKQYFILDFDFYVFRDKNTRFINPVYNTAEELYQIFVGGAHTNLGYSANASGITTTFYGGLNRTAYSFGINPLKMATTSGYLSPRLLVAGTTATYHYTPIGTEKVLNDNVCENGIVHNLQGVLVLPENAKK